MNGIDEIFCSIIRTLIGGECDLPLRLLRVGNRIAALRAEDFPRHLRGQVLCVRDMIIMLGLAGGFEDGRQHRDLTHDQAMGLALKILEIGYKLAVRKVS